jgi:2-(3-amino-3-carboxypropyl)histidine synthase
MTIAIDEKKIFRIINEKKPKGIVVNAPGGLLRQTEKLIEKIKSEYDIPCYLVGDSCYGICDTVDEDVMKLQADLAFHIGHNATSDRVGDFTYLIDAEDDIEFDAVIEQAIPILRKFTRLAVVTFSQHLKQLGKVKRRLEDERFEVYVGKKNNLLLDSQIFGCDFSTVFPLKEVVDAYCFLGESEFHAVGLALATGKPTYMLDPYMNQVVSMEKAADERRKRAVLAVYKALDAKVIGIITGLKEGQKMLGRTKWITRKLEMNGKKVVQLAMREITPDKLAPYRQIDAFVQTACPRISIDGFTFDRPVLSIPQADALVRLLEGREIGEFLERPKWIELTVGLIPSSVRK